MAASEELRLAPGTEIAGFRIVSQLGEGGMGVVYLADQASLKRKVALKVIAPALANSREFRERFEREAHQAAAIEHPNVVPIFETGEVDGRLFLAMRHVEGADLRTTLGASGAVGARDTANVIEQVAAALDAAHVKGLVHRDVKPANILLENGDPSKRAFLTDFGLTKEVADATALTNTGAWVGTLDYAAPEQIEAGAVDARTDVYALGCVAYEMLTGAAPFEGTTAQKMWAHMHSAPPSAADSGATKAVDEVIQRALAKEPDDRYPSAGDLGRALTASVAGHVPREPERSIAVGAAAATVPPAEKGTVAHSPAPIAPPPVRQEPSVAVHTAQQPDPPRSSASNGSSRLWLGVAALLAVVGIAAAAILVVPGLTEDEGGVSQDDLDQATKDAAQEAREDAENDAEVDALRDEVDDLEGDGQDEGSSPTSPSSTSTGEELLPADAGPCGGDVYSRTSSTQCDFAQNVASDYRSGSSNTVTSYSPTLDTEITMTCAGEDLVTCTGGDNAAVYILP